MDNEKKDTRAALKSGDMVIYESEDSAIRLEYNITGVLGKGGFSIIYRAERVGYGSVLLKELFPVEGYERFSKEEHPDIETITDGKIIRESSQYKNLKHYEKKLNRESLIGEKVTDGVARTSSVGQPFIATNGNIYAEMPKNQPCVSLQAVLDNPRSRNIGLRAWNELIWQLTDIIGLLHNRRKILHLDISPNNVIINGSDNVDETIDNITELGKSGHGDPGVWVIDFGSSAEMTDPSKGKAVIRGFSPGTGKFQAPELTWDKKGNGCDIYVSADIYSICRIYEDCVQHILELEDKSVPSTAIAQLKEIITIGTNDRSNRWSDTEALIAQLKELRQRLDYKGVSKAAIWEAFRLKAQYSLTYDPIKELLPSGQKSARLTEYGHLKDGDSRRIEKLIEETSGNAYLIGEGGIGKTTTLIHYARDVYKKDYDESRSVVPIYVELSNCRVENASKSSQKDDTKDRQKEAANNRYLIYRYILNALRSAELNHKNPTSKTVIILEDIEEDQIRILEALFNGERKETNNQAPEYLLMLDGLNEVSDTKIKPTDGSAQYSTIEILVKEINELAKCPNVRIILTSRSDNESMRDSSYQRIYITGLGTDEVRQYLDNAHIRLEKKVAAKNNEALMEILRIPLFLIVYTALADSLKDTADITTRGELLYAFLNDTKGIYTKDDESEKQTVYTQIRRINQLDSLPMKDSQYVFILDYILPYICWHMVIGDKTDDHRQTMELDGDTLCNLIEEALDESCPFYTGFKQRVPPRSDARSFEEYDVKGSSKTDRILFAITDTLRLFYEKGRNEDTHETFYKIIHQHYRDYFAALYMCQLMESACSSMVRKKPLVEAFDILQEIRERVISPDVLVFTGEVLGEHRNSPVLKDKQWCYNVPSLDSDKPLDRMQTLIKKTLGAFRERFGEDVGYGVYNLIEILKKVRKDLSHADLHELDLSSVTLNGVDLGERGGGANLCGAKITRENLFPMGHTGNINSIAFSPDSIHIVTASLDNTAKIWNVMTGSLLNTLSEHIQGVNHASYSPSGEYIVTASSDHTANVWDAKAGSIKWTITGHSASINSVAYSHDGKYIITASDDNTAKVYNIATESMIMTLEGHKGFVTSAIYSIDDAYIVTTSADKTAKIWEARTGSEIFTLRGHHKSVSFAAYSPDGMYIVTSSWDGTIRVWEAATGLHIITLEGHTRPVTSVSYSPDGKHIVSTSRDRTVKVWNTNTWTLQWTLYGHINYVSSAQYAPDSKHIVSVSWDSSVKVWDSETGALLNTFEGNNRSILSASYSPNCKQIVTASLDNTAKIWDVETGILLRRLTGHTRRVNSAHYNHDCLLIVTASWDNTAKIWDANTGLLLKTLVGHNEYVNSAEFSQDGSGIVTSSDDNTSIIWDTNSGRKLHVLKGHENWVCFASYSPDGKHIVTASWDMTAKIWDATTGSLLRSLEGHLDAVRTAVYSPDAKRILTASRDGTVKEWDAESASFLRDIDNSQFFFKSAAYSPNGKSVVTASNENIVNIIDTDTGILQKTINVGYEYAVISASFSSDGKYIVTASDEGTAKIWNAETGSCLDTIPNIHGLQVVGVDMRSINMDSYFSDDDKKNLRRYGAKIN